MAEKSIKRQAVSSKIFYENPYDLETFFETLSIASRNDKELLYVDRLIRELRHDSNVDLTHASTKILLELNLIKLP